MSPKSKSPARPGAAAASLFLDRIEGEVAVLELDGRKLELPRALLPSGTQEGDYLTLILARDPEATKKARARVQQRRKDLAREDDGGDIKL